MKNMFFNLLSTMNLEIFTNHIDVGFHLLHIIFLILYFTYLIFRIFLYILENVEISTLIVLQFEVFWMIVFVCKIQNYMQLGAFVVVYFSFLMILFSMYYCKLNWFFFL
jgi:hypothetical protein